jgi:hypothetical protein
VSERLKCVLVAPLNGRIRCQEGSFGESIGWRDLWSCWWRAHAAVFTFGLVGGCVAVCFSMLTGSTCRPVFACGDLGERHWTRTTYVCRRRPVETCVHDKPQGFALACPFHYYWLTIHLHRRSLVAVLHSVCRLWRRTLPSTIPLHAYMQMCVCTFALETWLLLAHTTPHPHLYASWWL